jgi:hypothetical protein
MLAIPGELNPLVVKTPFSFFVCEIDLTPAFEKSRAENSWYWCKNFHRCNTEWVQRPAKTNSLTPES